jgi:hypothetical protein
MIFYGLIDYNWDKITVITDYNPSIRVPTIEEMINNDIEDLHVCNTFHSKGGFKLSVLSGHLQWWVGIPWKKSYIKTQEDIELLGKILERGLIFVERKDDDRIKVYIKKDIGTLKIPWIYEWSYWSYKQWKQKLSLFHNPDDIISVVFDENIALYEIIKNL